MTTDVPASAPCVTDAALLNTGTVVARTPTRTEYPLATVDGIAALGQMLTADQAWRSMTPLQRELIGHACEAVLTGDLSEGQVVEPPGLAGASARTEASLRRKALLDDDGRLTLLAAWHGSRLAETGRQVRAERVAAGAGEGA